MSVVLAESTAMNKIYKRQTRGIPIVEPIPINAIPTVAEVVQELPVAMDIIEQIIKQAGRKIEGCKISSP